MNEIDKFFAEVAGNVSGLAADADLHALSRIWVREIARHKYAYNFCWMGRPIIQFPTDVIAVQELVWHVRPDLIIETGIAHGGSVVFSAALLALLDYADAVEQGRTVDPQNPSRRVLAVDIEIRPHNRAAIESHPMHQRIMMLEGSSVAPEVISSVTDIADQYKNVMVLLDSNHTHNHVVAELKAYGPLVTQGSYCVVFDTLIEQVPDHLSAGKPWGIGNNPMTAVNSFLASLADRSVIARDGNPLGFEIDSFIDDKLLISAAPRGFLKRIR